MGGSTGSGKSTITNTLAGAVVSKAGVIRPTTRAPTLICHPDDTPWFMVDDDDGVLAGLPRVTGEGDPSGHVLKVTEVGTMTPGLAIIDAPDIDSVALENRELATQLLASADLWLFTTTAVRYADAVPWEFLRRARDRGTSLSIIINRIPARRRGRSRSPPGRNDGHGRLRQHHGVPDRRHHAEPPGSVARSLGERNSRTARCVGGERRRAGSDHSPHARRSVAECARPGPSGARCRRQSGSCSRRIEVGGRPSLRIGSRQSVRRPHRRNLAPQRGPGSLAGTDRCQRNPGPAPELPGPASGSHDLPGHRAGCRHRHRPG